MKKKIALILLFAMNIICGCNKRKEPILQDFYKFSKVLTYQDDLVKQQLESQKGSYLYVIGKPKLNAQYVYTYLYREGSSAIDSLYFSEVGKFVQRTRNGKLHLETIISHVELNGIKQNRSINDYYKFDVVGSDKLEGSLVYNNSVLGTFEMIKSTNNIDTFVESANYEFNLVKANDLTFQDSQEARFNESKLYYLENKIYLTYKENVDKKYVAKVKINGTIDENNLIKFNTKEYYFQGKLLKTIDCDLDITLSLENENIKITYDLGYIIYTKIDK